MTTETVPSESPAPSAQLPCINPATGALIRELPIATEADVAQAVQAARLAFESWSRQTIARRASYLLRARDIMLDRRHQLLEQMIEETGKARVDATADIAMLAEAIGFYCGCAEETLADRAVQSRILRNKRLKVQYMPRGVVVNISPWNYPLELAWAPLIPALLAGNVVINKPSEVTPLISLAFRDILVEAGVPETVAQVLIGRGDVGAALCREADYVIFTGSVPTGRKVAMACAERLIPCTLELGGKDPAIVLEDADIDRTANGLVWGAFFNAGQTCISIERAYVVEDVYDELVDAVVRLTQSLRQGIDTGDYDIDVGSMIFPAQTDIVDRHVQDAIDKGATLRTGGRRNLDLPEGYFYEPTVLTDVNHDMLILTEETFGPVLPIMKVRDAEEALRYANDSDCGLSSSVWTRSQERGRAIARRLQSGSVCINETICNYLALEAPFGGVKHSGIGHRKTAEELRAYCHEKTVLEDIFRLKTEPWWYPYSPALGNGALKAIGLFYRSGLTHKIRALLS